MALLMDFSENQQNFTAFLRELNFSLFLLKQGQFCSLQLHLYSKLLQDIWFLCRKGEN